MTIGATIKQLRQEQDITQEQLAEALGITSRAVSQWENDRTAPDISQLPALANFFDVTTDYLLGVDIYKRKEAIDSILKYDTVNFGMIGDMDGSIRHLTEKIREYPNSHELIQALTTSLYSKYFQSSPEIEEAEKRRKAEEILALCDKGLKYAGKNISAIGGFYQTMVYLNTYLGNIEKAQELASSMPAIPCSGEMLYSRTLKGKDKTESHQYLLLNLMWYACHEIRRISWDEDYTLEEKASMYELGENLIHLIAGDDPVFYNDTLNEMCQPLMWVCKELGQTEKALDVLERGIGYAEAFENRPDVGKYSPCWLNLATDEKQYTTKHNMASSYEEYMDELERGGFFEAFKGNERFERLVERLKEKISK
ncbi:Helix-turn-helix [Ruminococcaceae bacterium FB2012]|nr:Helix-turn-helix [Ruminococcaceae bacterium FB2012]